MRSPHVIGSGRKGRGALGARRLCGSVKVHMGATGVGARRLLQRRGFLASQAGSVRAWFDRRQEARSRCIPGTKSAARGCPVPLPPTLHGGFR